MTPFAIQGIGVIGAFGCGVDDLSQRLHGSPDTTGRLTVPVAGEERTVPAYLADPAPLERFLTKRATRRIDHFSRMALLGAYLALEDAGALESSRERMGVIIATGYGATRTTFSFLDSVLDDGDSFASPTHFSNSVHNSAAAHVAIQLKATGPSLTVSQFGMSVASALLTARKWLSEGRVDHVLFGAVDEVSAVLGYCWESFFPQSTDHITPFAFDRQSAVPGEGAAFFLLSREQKGRYGRIAQVIQDAIGTLPPAVGPCLINASGQPSADALYRSLLPGSAEVAAYTPHYGSLPVGQAFDLAVAALAMRDGRLPAVPSAEGLASPWVLANGPLTKGQVTCLKCEGESFGGVTVEKG